MTQEMWILLVENYVHRRHIAFFGMLQSERNRSRL